MQTQNMCQGYTHTCVWYATQLSDIQRNKERMNGIKKHVRPIKNVLEISRYVHSILAYVSDIQIGVRVMQRRVNDKQTVVSSIQRHVTIIDVRITIKRV